MARKSGIVEFVDELPETTRKPRKTSYWRTIMELRENPGVWAKTVWTTNSQGPLGLWAEKNEFELEIVQRDKVLYVRVPNDE